MIFRWWWRGSEDPMQPISIWKWVEISYYFGARQWYLTTYCDIFFFISNEGISLKKNRVIFMRNEIDQKLYRIGSKEQLERVLSFLAQLATKDKKKRVLNGRWIAEKISEYLSVRFFQIAQIITYRHRNHTLLETFPGLDSLQEKPFPHNITKYCDISDVWKNFFWNPPSGSHTKPLYVLLLSYSPRKPTACVVFILFMRVQ